MRYAISPLPVGVTDGEGRVGGLNFRRPESRGSGASVALFPVVELVRVRIEVATLRRWSARTGACPVCPSTRILWVDFGRWFVFWRRVSSNLRSRNLRGGPLVCEPPADLPSDGDSHDSPRVRARVVFDQFSR